MEIKVKYKKDIYVTFKIDEQDLHFVIGEWCQASLKGDRFYLFNRRRNKYIHRLIMGEPFGLVVDHIDGDSTNNLRSNLRITTHANNMANQRKAKNNKSGYKGVSFEKESEKWRASICYKRKCLNLGRYDTKEQAAQAYNKKAIELWGEYASLNIIE